MGKEETIDALRALATGDGRPQSDRLIDIIDEVEAALTAGVRRGEVLATLHRHYGFTLTMSGFNKALRAARGRRKEGGGAARPESVPHGRNAAPPPAPDGGSAQPSKAPAYTPAELKIRRAQERMRNFTDETEAYQGGEFK